MATCVHGEWYVGNGNMVCGRGCEKRASDIIDELTVELQSADSWIQRQRCVTDHACAECVPNGTIVIAGFRCAWHAALSRSCVSPTRPDAPGKRS